MAIYEGGVMAYEEIRDRHNRLLGLIRDVDEKLEPWDANSKLKVYYYQKINETRDQSNRLIGKGNLLTTLL